MIPAQSKGQPKLLLDQDEKLLHFCGLKAELLIFMSSGVLLKHLLQVILLCPSIFNTSHSPVLWYNQFIEDWATLGELAPLVDH